MQVSIFNDVVGPVMRGPSSSHCAAALRIGRLARDLVQGDLKDLVVEFDRGGSLATTHESQGSDMGLFGGLLGWEATDPRLPEAARALDQSGVSVRIEIGEFGFEHPNTYRLTLMGDRNRHTMTALSTGGGMIEVVGIDGFALSIEGDYHETLIFGGADGPDLAQRVRDGIQADHVLLHRDGENYLVQVKADAFVGETVFEGLDHRGIRTLGEVLPVPSRRGQDVPFSTCDQMLSYNDGRGWLLWRLAAKYESARGGMTEPDVIQRMVEIVRILRRSIAQGLAGTEYRDRILGHQSGGFVRCAERGQLLEAGLLNRIISYVTALMEVKSAMGVIVAAPTAGACAAFPGACLATGNERGADDETVAWAMLAGGLIGVFIATRSTLAAEVAGCQAECGAAASMAAAALAGLGNGSAAQSVAAASMALQNSMGLTCDPVANRVEVPCLGKNVMAASNALACANMALAGYDPVIGLDEVIAAADAVGRSLPRELRCTALGGLSVTPTSKRIQSNLRDRAEFR